MTSSYLTQLNKAYEQQTKLMEQSDGSKLHRASDDAVGYSKYLRYSNSKTENTQYQANVKTAISWMKNSDSAMVDVADCFATVVTKANAAANTTNNSSDMTAIAKEMLSMVQQAVSDGNTQVNGRYLFSGQSDLTQPFTMSTTKYDRGLAKTLSDSQKSFFNNTDSSGSMSQMLTLNDGTDTYYLNTKTGKVYTSDFVTSGYADKVAAGQTTVTDADAAGTAEGFVPDSTTGVASSKVSDYFDKNGVVLDTDGKQYTGAAGQTAKTLTVTINGTEKTLNFTTVKQYIATYNGDSKYISMTKNNGAQDQTSDTVNVTGQDLFGADIFDDTGSGNTVTSGTAAINDMLTVVAQTESDQYAWMTSDGITLANNSYNTVNTAETKMASRQQVYEDVQSMLTTQGTAITSDISGVADTDVASLAVQLMTAETIYNMSLSVGSKILPKSLADYLS